VPHSLLDFVFYILTCHGLVVKVLGEPGSHLLSPTWITCGVGKDRDKGKSPTLHVGKSEPSWQGAARRWKA